MSNLAELKKLYLDSRRVTVTVGEKDFIIEKPSDMQWPKLLDLMSKAEQDNSNVTSIIRDRVKGWDKVIYSDVFEDLEKDEGDKLLEYDDELFSFFLSNNPQFIVALSQEITNVMIKTKEKEERKKKSRK